MASMRCPKCGSEQADGAVICDACDAILDTSFLEEEEDAALDDEGTDPGIAAPAEGGTQIVEAGALAGAGRADAGERTFVGARPSRDADVEDEDDAWDDEDDAYDDGTFDDEEVYDDEAEDADAYETFDYRRYVEADRAREEDEDEEVISARARGVPDRTSQEEVHAQAAARDRGRIREALDFDTSSQLMDDYDQLFHALWEGIRALPATDKVFLVGACLAAITALLPWRVEVSPAGVADDVYGLFDMGWLGLLLAAASIGLIWYRHSPSTPPRQARVLALVAVGLCAGGVLWSVVSLGVEASSGKVLIGNPYGVTPGAAYGVYLHLAAWTVAGIGALVSLKDLPASRR